MPKRVPPLSAKKLNSIRPGERPVEVVDGYVPGLRVRVSPSGTRTWSLNIRDSKGVRRRFDVGAELGLSQARRKAEDLRRSIRDGADPTKDRRASRRRAQAAREGDGTLAALIDDDFTTGPGAKQARASKSKRLVKTVFEKALAKPALDLERSELQLFADIWRSKSTASLAVRLLRPNLAWAEKRGLVPSGIHDLEQPGSPGRRERVLTDGELRAIWAKLDGTHGDVIRWLIWTGCHFSEAAGMRWREIDADTWNVPATRTKTAQARSIPLPRQAVALLDHRLHGDDEALVFPSRRCGVLSNWDRETKKIQARSGTTGWHRHDLRRTVATKLGDLGFAPHIIGVVLGHADIAQGATAVYARSRYQREHRDALQTLADALAVT